MADLNLPIKLGSGVAAAQEYYRGTAAPRCRRPRRPMTVETAEDLYIPT